MNQGEATARDRLLAAVRGGDWQRVPQEAEAYAAAVRADERQRVLRDASEAIRQVFESVEDAQPTEDLKARCLTALDGLR